MTSTAEAEALALIHKVLAHEVLARANGPTCEATYKCVTPGCTECDKPVRLCQQPATDRVTAECDTAGCACRLVLLLCTYHADLAMTDWPNAIERRAL